jgi:MFS family permease
MSEGGAKDSLPPEDHLTPAETRRALWVAAIAWGVFGSAWGAMVSGAPFVAFAREKLGASTFVYGLFSSLPFLGVLAQLPGSWWTEHTRRRKSLFLITATLNRAIWFVVAALPWIIPERYGGARVGALLALVVVGSTVAHAGTPAWVSWFADMVPESIRGRYLGKRQALATTTAVVVSAVVSHIVDVNDSFHTFAILFSIAAVFGLADIELFLLVREPAMPKRESPWRLRDVLFGPLSSRPFRGYLLYAFSEAFMFGFAGPFFWLMGLEGLGIGNFWSNFYVALVPMIFTALALPAWGSVCDRFGARPLVTMGTIMSISFPVCWVLATPGHYHALLATCAVIGGLFGAAISVGDMSMLFSLTPREGRSAYLAMFFLAANLGCALAPALAGGVAQSLRPVHFHLAGWTFGQFHFLMFISIALRLLHVIFVIPRLPDTRSQPTGELVRHLVRRPFRRGGEDM